MYVNEKQNDGKIQNLQDEKFIKLGKLQGLKKNPILKFNYQS
jgi:hypothetical protein